MDSTMAPIADLARIQLLDELLTTALGPAGITIGRLRRPSTPDVVECCEALAELAAAIAIAVDRLVVPADAEAVCADAVAALRGIAHCAALGRADREPRDRVADDLAVHARGATLARDALRQISAAETELSSPDRYG
jgi:hypothetical protein